MHETDDSPKSRTSPCLGIIGGGQLARMTAMSALQLGCDVVILEKSHSSPAATLATHSLVGDWTKPGPVLDLASRVDVVTLENEFVDASLLRMLEEAGHTVFPTSSTLATVFWKSRRVSGTAAFASRKRCSSARASSRRPSEARATPRA